MGVVSPEGRSRLSAGSELALETLHLGAGERARGRRRAATTCSCSPSRAAARSPATGSRAARRRSCSRASRRRSGAGADGLSLVRVTLGADTDLHAPMGTRERIVAIERGRAGKGNRQPLLPGALRPAQRLHARDDVRRLRAAGQGAVALPPLRRDRAGSGAAPAATTSATRSSRSRTAPRSGSRRGEVHIVENTSPDRELAVLGIFTPAGSPSAAYLTPDVAASYVIGPS